MFVFYNINNRLNSMIRYPKKGISLSLRDSRKQNTNITQTLIAADSNVSWHSRPVLQYSYITRMASSGETTQSKISGMSETLGKGKCN